MGEVAECEREEGCAVRCGEISCEFAVFVELVEQLICVGVEGVFDAQCVNASELSVDEQGVVQSPVHTQGVIRNVVSWSVAAFLVEEFSNRAKLLLPFFIGCSRDVVQDLIGDICKLVSDARVCYTSDRGGVFVADQPIPKRFCNFGEMHPKFVCCSDTTLRAQV